MNTTGNGNGASINNNDAQSPVTITSPRHNSQGQVGSGPSSPPPQPQQHSSTGNISVPAVTTSLGRKPSQLKRVPQQGKPPPISGGTGFEETPPYSSPVNQHAPAPPPTQGGGATSELSPPTFAAEGHCQEVALRDGMAAAASTSSFGVAIDGNRTPPQHFANWAEVFEAAQLPTSASEKYAKLFAENEMPAPSAETLRWYLDNEFLQSVGIKLAGHRAAVLSVCRSLLQGGGSATTAGHGGTVVLSRQNSLTASPTRGGTSVGGTTTPPLQLPAITTSTPNGGPSTTIPRAVPSRQQDEPHHGFVGAPSHRPVGSGSALLTAPTHGQKGHKMPKSPRSFSRPQLYSNSYQREDSGSRHNSSSSSEGESGETSEGSSSASGHSHDSRRKKVKKKKMKKKTSSRSLGSSLPFAAALGLSPSDPPDDVGETQRLLRSEPDQEEGPEIRVSTANQQTVVEYDDEERRRRYSSLYSPTVPAGRQNSESFSSPHGVAPVGRGGPPTSGNYAPQPHEVENLSFGQLDAMRFAQVDASQLNPSDRVTINTYQSNPASPHPPFTWVDISGRDRSRADFKRALQDITHQYNFSESLLLDMDLSVALPQVITTQEEDSQYLVILRVATEKTDIEEDSLHELTNRWMVAVNTANSTIITIHRMDSTVLAKLRLGWEQYHIDCVSFHAFICKIFDDSIVAYIDALQESEFLLDKYEGVMLRHSVGGADGKEKRKGRGKKRWCFWRKKAKKAELQNNRELNAHFGSLTTRSKANVMPLLQLEEQDKLTKQRMNQLLYHLHRRASVYSRMLSLTQAALESAYSSLRVCSSEYAEQMSRSCGELALKAEALHDNCQNLLNLHLSLVSFRTNELMNILTVFSAFFIPLTFISGVYGMNFINMPELYLHYGYYYCLTGMLIITVLVFIFFRSKGLI